MASVRTPQPLNISGDISRSATTGALSSSTIPVHRQWPMLDASASTGRFVAVEADGEPAAVGQPELLVESVPCSRAARSAHWLGDGRVAGARRRSAPAPGTRRRRSPAPRTARSAPRAIRAVGEVDAVPRVLPALVGQAPVGRALVLDEPVAVAVAVVLDPVQRPVGVRQQRVDLGARQPPAAQLAEQHHEQRRRVDRAVVDAAAAEGERRRATPNRISCRIRPGSSSVARFTTVALAAASVCSVPSASVGSSGSAMYDESSESRPNSAMNQGAPAATAAQVGLLRVEDPQRAQVLEAALQRHLQGMVRA